MTREKAIEVDKLLCKIEAYEALLDELLGLQVLEEIVHEYSDHELEKELLRCVQQRLEVLTKELEEM